MGNFPGCPASASRLGPASCARFGWTWITQVNPAGWSSPSHLPTSAWPALQAMTLKLIKAAFVDSGTGSVCGHQERPSIHDE